MKKITEKQLIESSSRLREYMRLVEEPGSQQKPPSFWDAITGSATPMFPSIQQKPQSGGQAQVPTNTPVSQSAKPTSAIKWPSTPEEIITFQKTHKQLDGSPLKPDGLIGPQTLQALAAAGIQPPPGFKMVGTKKPAATPVTAKQPQNNMNVSQTDYDAAEAEYQQNKSAHDAEYAAAMAAINEPRRQTAAQSAAPTQGMTTGMDTASKILNNQNFASLQNNPAYRSASAVANEEKLLKSVNALWETIEKIDEAGIGTAIKAAKSFGRGLVNRTNPNLPSQGGKFMSTTQAEKDANKFGREVNKQAAATAAGVSGATAGMVGNDVDDPTNLQPTDLQKPAGYYSDTAAANRMTGATADAGRDALAKSPGVTPVTPDQINYQDPGNIKTRQISEPTDNTGQSSQNTQLKDPGIEKIQQDLKNKGYDIKVDGILGPETEKMIAYDKQFGADYAATKNAELSAPVSESVTFGQEVSLARLIQLSK